VTLLITGLVALGVALVRVLFAVGIEGRPDDVIFDIEGLGGPTDDAIASILTFVLGTAGVVCVLKSWRDVRDAAFGGARGVQEGKMQ
jgi:hypothetical protein